MVDLVMQPWDGPGLRAGEILETAISKRLGYSQLLVAIAFAKSSGIARLRGAIEGFLANKRRSVEIFVGIDALGTSREALEMLLDMGVQSFIFYNPSSMFHPKLYVLKGAEESFVLIGSSNLTAGGLYTNYELSAGFKLAADDDGDTGFMARIDQFFLTVRQSPNCKTLTPELLTSLIKSRLLGDEKAKPGWETAAASEARRFKKNAAALFPRTPVPSLPLLGHPWIGKGDERVVIVGAGRYAESDFRKYGAYICLANRSLGGAQKIAFYYQGSILRDVPAIKAVVESVSVSKAGFKDIARASLSPGLRREAESLLRKLMADPSRTQNDAALKLVLLSNRGDPDTSRLPNAIVNDKMDYRGRRVAWVRRQRYASLAELRRAKRTSELGS